MPRPSPSIVGNRFGRLIGLERLPDRKVRVQCDCGIEKIVHMSHLVQGRTRSCGCLHREVTSKMLTERQTTHGYFGTKIYSVWNSMLDRCCNPRHYSYARYGGRGITVCERWFKFENFLADMGEAPAGLTLDRIDNDNGYSPENCRWATVRQQMNNRGTCRLLTHAGRTQNVTQWAEELGIPRKGIYDLLYRGIPEDEVIAHACEHGVSDVKQVKVYRR